ncbi:MAG: family 10 glycosylhydrolase, partial [bacterium]
KKQIFTILLLILIFSPKASTQHQELRGAWIATVINLDWPTKGATPEKQQKELLYILDRLQISGINTIFFQIRCEADAFYQSELEPWSFYLTGKQGQTPDPFWDTVVFAKTEAHKRGMELHLWLN